MAFRFQASVVFFLLTALIGCGDGSNSRSNLVNQPEAKQNDGTTKKGTIGFAAAKDAIESHPDLAAIFAINDPSAIGARKALEAVGKQDQVRIIGFDGAIEGKQAILAGQIVCDPIQFPEKMGKTTIEMILKYFDGEKPPEEILIPSKLYYMEDAKNDPALTQPAE